MKNQINPRDYEMISAYLDNQLGTQERALLESRLKVEPELRQVLQDLGNTRLLIRSLPKLRAPRNYTLSAKTLGVRPMLRLAPALGMISAISSILLAFLVFSNIILTSAPQVAMAPVAMEVSGGSVPSVAITSTSAAPAIAMQAQILTTATLEVGILMSDQTLSATTTPMIALGQPASPTLEYPTPPLNDATRAMGTPLPSVIFEQPSPTPTPHFGILRTGEPTTPTATHAFVPGTGEMPPYLVGTPTITPTDTPTASPTATPSPTPTYTPTATPTLPTPYPPGINVFPATETAKLLATEPARVITNAPGEGMGSPTISVSPIPGQPAPSPNYSFLGYVLLAFEITLALFAIAAGLAAIIIRIKAGR